MNTSQAAELLRLVASTLKRELSAVEKEPEEDALTFVTSVFPDLSEPRIKTHCLTATDRNGDVVSVQFDGYGEGLSGAEMIRFSIIFSDGYSFSPSIRTATHYDIADKLVELVRDVPYRTRLRQEDELAKEKKGAAEE